MSLSRLDTRFNALLACLCFWVIAASCSGAKSAQRSLAVMESELEIGNYGKILESCSSSTDVRELVLNGRAAFAGENRELAWESFSKAITIAPNDSEALIWHGYFLSRRESYKEAQAELQRAVTLNPRSADARSMLGRCLYSMGAKDQGLKDMNKALQMDPKSLIALENLADTYTEEMDPDKTAFFLSALVSNYPRMPRLWVKHGGYFVSHGKFAKALSDYDHAISINPQCQLALYKRADMMFNSGHYAEALLDATRALSADNVGALVVRCLRIRVGCNEQQKRFDKAIKDLNVLCKGLPHSQNMTNGERDILLQRAKDYEELKDYSQALESIAVVQHFQPNNTEALYRKARVYSEKGAFTEALNEFNKLIEIDSTIAEWYTARAGIYEKLGKAAAATNDRRKAAELDAN